MFSKILNKIKTKDDVYHLLTEIDILLASVYENGDRGFESTLGSRARSWVSEMVSEEIVKEKKAPEDYLKSVKEFLGSLPSINLTLSFEPSSNAIDKFSSYLRESTGGDVVLDIQIDKTILGGVILSYKGIYKDFSIARLISESEATIEETIREKMVITL